MQINIDLRRSLSRWEEDCEILGSIGKGINDFVRHRENYERFLDGFAAEIRVDCPLALEMFGNPAACPLPDGAKFSLNANQPRGLNQHYLIANGTRLSMDDPGIQLIQFLAESPGATLAELIKRSAAPEEKVRELITDLCRNDILGLVY